MENAMRLLNAFLEDRAPMEARYKKHVSGLQQYEAELHATFEKVERHTYVTTLHFATAEEYMDYLVQVCKSVEAELEQRRAEFLDFLRGQKNEDGKYTFVRDTYLYRCGREA